jgi:uncharacterized protein (DUF1810 family)
MSNERSASSRLDRFKTAQKTAFDVALNEIRTGGKRGHWIWYVFPQLAGLGSSSTSQLFGIEDEEEAAAYLRDPELRTRLLTITTAVADQLKTQARGQAKTIRALMGSEIDAQKLVSSLTLFEHIARKQEGEGEAYKAMAAAAEDVLTIAAAQGYPRCAFTLQQLGRR